MIKDICIDAFVELKNASLIPVHTGKFKNGMYYVDNGIDDGGTFQIFLPGNIGPLLEGGTLPHDIPRAFGRDDMWSPFKFRGDFTLYPFGIGGRFGDKFHPGSFKHEGFWQRSRDLVYASIAKRGI